MSDTVPTRADDVRDRAVLNLPAPELDPAANVFMCCLRLADVDVFSEAARGAGVPEGARGFPRLHPERRQAWGLRAGAPIDPNGSQLTLI